MVAFLLIGLISGIAAAIASSLAAGAATAWQTSPLGRSRRLAKRAIKPVRDEARRVEKALKKHGHRLRRASGAFAKARSEERLAEVPLEALRDAGAAQVRWSALREAGFETLRDLEGRPARELARVRGIGKTTAPRIAEVASEMARKLRAESTNCPRPDLSQASARPLAEATLDYLEARDAGGDAPRRVVEKARDYDRRLAEIYRDSTFGRWLIGLWNKTRRTRTVERSEQLARDADAWGRSGVLEESQLGRQQIRSWRPPPRDPATLVRRFRDRYTDCCALLEHFFGKLGLRQQAISQGQGGVTDEVARRVEGFALRTAGMRVALRRYQEFGAKYVLAQERVILGDEMGLGKTMQALTAMTHLHEEDPRARFFVVAPAGLLINWLREIEKFTPLDGYLLHGDQLASNLERWAQNGGVAVTSYATLRNVDLGTSLQGSGGTIDLSVADEAHFIKNPEAARTQAVRRVLERSSRACLMSGTPMENHPREFLELIDAIRPKDAGQLRRANLQLDAAAGSAGAFHRAVAKIYLRRNQEDVLSELPEKIELETWVELSPVERRDYSRKVRDKNFMGMRQAATISPTTGASAKLDHLAELLEDHRRSGRKVLVFSYFLGVLKAVAQRFDAVGTISGAVSAPDKQALCDEFQAREGHAVLALQIQAGGQGFNLQKASAVVLMEPQTKPSLEDQAVARAHRMGQTQRVLVHRLFARGTCDESLIAILAEKAVLFDAYARQSLVKEASGQATETSLTAAVMQAERARLNRVRDSEDIETDLAV